MEFKTSGVCSRKIKFDIVDDRVKNVEFVSGCDGNLTGIGKLVEGMKVEEVIEKLEGIRCGDKKTSCPDQLVLALKAELQRSKQ